MLAITIWQPWATLIMIGAKPWEFRGWDYAARGYAHLIDQRVVIHAGARPIKRSEMLDLRARVSAGDSSLDAKLALPIINKVLDAHRCKGVLPLAAALGTAKISRARRVGDIFKGLTVNDSDRIDHSLFGWPLSDIKHFPSPLPCRGLQGFWNFPADLEKEAGL